MSGDFIIYCLREVGTTEPRYIGQTSKTPHARLVCHRSEARSGGGQESSFGHWLNTTDVEAVEICRAKTREEAKEIERTAIIVCAGMGFRILNRDHTPRHLKAPKYIHGGRRPMTALGNLSRSGLAA